MGIPCKDCENRCINCHSTCDIYKDWRQQRDDDKERVLKIKIAERNANNRRNDAIRRIQKRYNNH